MTDLSAESAYLFRHAIVRDAAYELHTPSGRAALHELALDLLEQLLAGSPMLDALALELAAHARAAALARTRSLKGGLYKREAELLQRAARHAYDRGRLMECLGILQMLESHPAVSLSQRIQVKLRTAQVLQTQGRGRDALTMAEAALQDARKGGTANDVSDALAAFGELQTRLGLSAPAETTLTELLGHSRLGTDELRLSEAERLLGTLYTHTGRFTQAEELLEAALARRAKVGDESNMVRVYNSRAAAAMSQQQYAKARDLYEKGLAAAKAAGNRISESAILGTLGWLAVEEDRLGDAAALARKAHALARENGDRYTEAYQLCTLAGVTARQGEFAQSEDFFEASLTILREIGNRPFEGTTLRDFAELRERQGQLEKAADMFAAAILIHREVRDRVGEGFAFGRLALVEYGLGRETDALHSWTEMQRILDQPADEGLRRELIAAMTRLGGPPGAAR